MAPTDSFTPAGSSTYSSDTMYVGDGTWIASKNTFLLPNLVGLNFDTLRYNGMGNRFATLPQYNQIILGHGILAVITFLFILPIAILMSQFYTASPFWALRIHIYLQILTILLSTVVFALGWFAVGPSRSFTNPHHGIGLAIYVSVLVQGFLGAIIHRLFKKKIPKRLPLSLMLHQWLGKSTAMLGFAQVPLGLALYGSSKFTFVLYAIWMAFLLLLLFFLNYRARPVLFDSGRDKVNEVLLTGERKSNPAGSLLGSYSIGAGPIPIFHGSRQKSRERSHSRSRRLQSTTTRQESFLESESYTVNEKRSSKQEKGGLMDRLLKVALIGGVAGLAKSRFDEKKRKRESDGYSTVSPNITPKPSWRRHSESQVNEETDYSIETEETGTRMSSNLPRLRNPAASTALGTSEIPQSTPGDIHDRDSYDSESYFEGSTAPPFKREEKPTNILKRIFPVVCAGLIAKRFADKRSKDMDTERMSKDQLEDKTKIQQTRRFSGKRSNFVSKQNCPKSSSCPSDISSTQISNDSDSRAPKPFPSSLIPVSSSQTPQSKPNFRPREYIEMPKMPPDSQGILHKDSESSSSQNLPAQKRQRRDSSLQRTETKAIKLAALDEEQRQESDSRVIGAPALISDVPESSVSVKVKLHDDNHITLRRLTREEAAAEREARVADRRHRRAESLSSLSGIDTAASQRRYRRGEIETERRTDSLAQAIQLPSDIVTSGRNPLEGSNILGKPEPGKSSNLSMGLIGSNEGYEAWSALSPGNDDHGEAAAERRRRRRFERSQKSGIGSERISERVAS